MEQEFFDITGIKFNEITLKDDSYTFAVNLSINTNLEEGYLHFFIDDTINHIGELLDEPYTVVNIAEAKSKEIGKIDSLTYLFSIDANKLSPLHHLIISFTKKQPGDAGIGESVRVGRLVDLALPIYSVNSEQ